MVAVVVILAWELLGGQLAKPRLLSALCERRAPRSLMIAVSIANAAKDPHMTCRREGRPASHELTAAERGSCDI